VQILLHNSILPDRLAIYPNNLTSSANKNNSELELIIEARSLMNSKNNKGLNRSLRDATEDSIPVWNSVIYSNSVWSIWKKRFNIYINVQNVMNESDAKSTLSNVYLSCSTYMLMNIYVLCTISDSLKLSCLSVICVSLNNSKKILQLAYKLSWTITKIICRIAT